MPQFGMPAVGNTAFGTLLPNSINIRMKINTHNHWATMCALTLSADTDWMEIEIRSATLIRRNWINNQLIGSRKSV